MISWLSETVSGVNLPFITCGHLISIMSVGESGWVCSMLPIGINHRELRRFDRWWERCGWGSQSTARRKSKISFRNRGGGCDDDDDKTTSRIKNKTNFLSSSNFCKVDEVLDRADDFCTWKLVIFYYHAWKAESHNFEAFYRFTGTESAIHFPFMASRSILICIQIW